MGRILIGMVAAGILLAAPAALAGGVTAVDPRVEGRASIEDLAIPAPRFSWKLDGEGAQTAYQLRVTQLLTRQMRDLVWDTRQIEGDLDCLVYAGPPLRNHGRFQWQVRVWDGAERSQWSTPSHFTTGDIDRAAAPGSCPVEAVDAGEDVVTGTPG